MTLDELISEATQLRQELGGDAVVLMLTSVGYSPVALTDMPFFSGSNGEMPALAVLVGPDVEFGSH